MPSETETLVSAAHEALDSGDWSTARASFEAALEQEQTAEALSGLGDTLCWLGETHDAVRCFERAYAIFYKRPDPAQASVAAISLTCSAASASATWPPRAAGWRAPCGLPTSSTSARWAAGCCWCAPMTATIPSRPRRSRAGHSRPGASWFEEDEPAEYLVVLGRKASGAR